MKGLWKAIKWLPWVVAVTVTLFLLNLAYFRMRGPNKAQDAALAKIAELNARPALGDNAFALLWLMPYDVADDQIEAIAADAVRRAQARIASGKDLTRLIPTDWPLLPKPSNTDPGLCERRDSGCLARVRENPEVTRELLARYPRNLQRAHNLESKSSFRNEIPITLVSPLPISASDSAQRLRLSELALAWQDGQRAEAMAGTCRNIDSWRQLRHGSNSLVVSMIAVVYIDGATRLFGDMLAELPRDEPLPANCAAAFAPIVADDVSLCTEIAGEFLLSEDAYGKIEGTSGDKPDTFGKRVVFDGFIPLLFNKRQALAWRAQEISEANCSDEVVQQALLDKLIERQPASPPLLESAANMIGRILHNIGAPAFEKYSARLLDSAAHLRLAATLIWLRETRDDARPIATRFAERAAQLRSGERATGVAEDGRFIWVDNLDQQHGARFSLPLAQPLETQQ